MPRRIVREDLVLPASYANFYIANNCVLLPMFADPMDEPARETLQRLFPDRKVVGIDCRELIWGLGTFHCLTQQQPALPRLERSVRSRQDARECYGRGPAELA